MEKNRRTVMAEETQETNLPSEPTPTILSAMSSGQPNQTPPNIDHYKSLVEMAHQEIVGVRVVYIWLAGALGLLLSTALLIAYFSISSSLNDLKTNISKEIELYTKTLKNDLDSRVQQMQKEAKENINKSVQEEITKVSENLHSIGEVFPVMEYEFYKVEAIYIEKDLHFWDEYRNEFKKKLSEFCEGGEEQLSKPRPVLYPYIVNEDIKIFLSKAGSYRLGNVKSEHLEYQKLEDLKYLNIPESLKGVRYIDYYISTFGTCLSKWKNLNKEEIEEKIKSIFLNLQKEATFRIVMNNSVIWKIERVKLQLEPTTQEEFEGGTMGHGLFYKGKVDIERFFRDSEKIKQDYRNALLSEK
jgi:hypothetical protein